MGVLNVTDTVIIVQLFHKFIVWIHWFWRLGMILPCAHASYSTISFPQTEIFLLKQDEMKTRSSRLGVFCKKGVLRNFANFTGKRLCQSLFLIKLQAEGCNFFKKETLRTFEISFEISKKTLSYRTPPVAASGKLKLINFLNSRLHSFPSFTEY